MADSILLTNVTNCDMTLTWGCEFNGAFKERIVRLAPRQIYDLVFICDDDKNRFYASHEIESLVGRNKLLVTSKAQDDEKMTKEQGKMKEKTTAEKQKINEQTKENLNSAIEKAGVNIKVSEQKAD